MKPDMFLGLIALAAAALATATTTPLWRSLCRKVGLMDMPGHRKLHDHSIPLAGGLAVLSGLFFASALLWILISERTFPGSPMTRVAAPTSPQIRLLAVMSLGAIGLTLSGGIDDRFELRPGPKFAAQLLFATLAVFGGFRLPPVIPNQVVAATLSVFWILAVINAVNFMDNMNGLCAGIGTVGSGCFIAWGLRHEQWILVSVAGSLAGATLGFLPFNFPRATAFLGDAGSHLIGYLLALLTLWPASDRAIAITITPADRWTPLLLVAIPILDLSWVVVLRWRLGKPFYFGDMNHLSHRLVRRGFSPSGAVVLIWLFCAALGVIAVCLD